MIGLSHTHKIVDIMLRNVVVLEQMYRKLETGACVI